MRTIEKHGEKGQHTWLVLVGGAIDRELTLFSAAASVQLGLAAKTVIVYLYALARFFDWLEQDAIARREKWGRFEEPRLVRAATERRLLTKHACRVQRRSSEVEAEICLVKPSSATRSSLLIELQALRAFYELCSRCGLYGHPNPLRRQGQRTALETMRSPIVPSRGRMPRRSGVDPPPSRSSSDSYYCIIGDLWRPDIRAAPDMRHKLLQEAATAGSSLRYESALRVMCDSGSRVSEACGVTMENWWRGSRFGTAIDSPSKGSGDVPVKVLSLSKDTAKALRTYVDTERRRLDPEGRGLEEFELLGRRGDLPHSTPIFLTRNRTQLSPEQFRNQFFNPLARRAGFDISPHGTRHNFVSLALDEIDLVADTPARRQMLREELVSLLAWAQGDRMLKVYDRRSKGRRILEVIERVREKQDSAPVARVGSTELAADAQPSVISKIMGRPT